MKINYIHDFNNRTEDEFLKIQNSLRGKLQIDQAIELKNVKRCAGVDIAYWEENGTSLGACSILIIDAKTKEVIEKVESYGKIEVPYIPGFLAFRELQLILEAASKIESEPDVFIFDGNGILHHNKMGIASHASFFLDKPTMGVSKSYFKVKNTDFIMPGNNLGDYTEIIIDDEVYGRTVRSRKDTKPIFLSCGNYIDIDSCYEIIMSLISKDSRIPIPTRLADLETHRLREKYSKVV